MIIRIMYNVSWAGGFAPITPLTFLPWRKKVSKKSQDCARFAQKTFARKAKNLQTPLRQLADRQTGVF